jgi:uncharacterized protein YbaR (Trm112 family)
MQDYLVEMLVCPVCHGELDWLISERSNSRIEKGMARCNECSTEYPVQDGIGLFLTPDLRRDDLWEQVDSHLLQYLEQHPAVEKRLMETPVAEMAPADLFFRALLVEEGGDFREAQAIEKLADQGIYTADFRACAVAQIGYVVEQLSQSSGVTVDIASGRGYLVEELARSQMKTIVATDFSPRVLRRDRRFLEYFGLYDQVSLLAFDARRTPFRDRSVGMLTTNLGLPNIEQPQKLLPELRRIASGSFLAINHFYPEDDMGNADALREAGLSPLLYRQSALDHFSSAGWHVRTANECLGKAQPTPVGTILEGAGIDAFPVNETTLEWCVMVAH